MYFSGRFCDKKHKIILTIKNLFFLPLAVDVVFQRIWMLIKTSF